MVQGFTSQSGGTVHIESEPGHGTTVSMLFPAVAADEGARPAPRRAPAPRLPALRALLVEDDEAVGRLLARLLERAGLRVTTAASGDAAIAQLESDSELALLVTDMVLPGRAQGAEVVRHARDQRPEMPILVLTGYAEDASLLTGGSADAVLTKPARRELLLETIERIIRERSAAP
jgi:Response regulator containing CheY-like receiver, AAA-type ATPase, and DNA-binding domains